MCTCLAILGNVPSKSGFGSNLDLNVNRPVNHTLSSTLGGGSARSLWGNTARFHTQRASERQQKTHSQTALRQIEIGRLAPRRSTPGPRKSKAEVEDSMSRKNQPPTCFCFSKNRIAVEKALLKKPGFGSSLIGGMHHAVRLRQGRSPVVSRESTLLTCMCSMGDGNGAAGGHAPLMAPLRG